MALSHTQKVVLQVVGRNDPCPCQSGLKYKRCHGGPNPPLSSMPSTAKYFIVAEPGTLIPLRDPNGNILVFTKRERAIARGSRSGLRTLSIIGMNDEKWELFQKAERYIVADDVLSPFV